VIQTKKANFAKSCPFLIITLAVTFIFAASVWAQPDKKSGLVGGPCKYRSYPGYATILSITGNSADDKDKVGRFEVKFSFSPKDKITETFAQVEGKTFNLYGNNFQYPDEEFLVTNNIRTGKVMEGSLQVIISGTCTPVLFEFPVLKQGK
jgi:hypothetical protein